MTAPHPIITQLRDARTASGLSRAALARRMGWAEYSLLQWETGRRSPRLEGLVDYAAALGYQITLTPVREVTVR